MQRPRYTWRYSLLTYKSGYLLSVRPSISDALRLTNLPNRSGMKKAETESEREVARRAALARALYEGGIRLIDDLVVVRGTAPPSRNASLAKGWARFMADLATRYVDALPTERFLEGLDDDPSAFRLQLLRESAPHLFASTWRRLGNGFVQDSRAPIDRTRMRVLVEQMAARVG